MKDKELNEDVDRKLRQYFYSKGEKIDTSDCLFSNIESELNTHRLNFNKVGFRVLAIVAAISVIMTVAAFGKMDSVKYYSYNMQTYRDGDVLQFNHKDADLDFNPKYVMEFDNGYKLKEIDITDTFGINDLNFKCNEVKNAEFKYIKDDKEILLKAHKKDDVNLEKGCFMKYKNPPYYNSSVKDVPVFTWQMERKYVPDGYMLTENDEDFIEADMLDIAFGSSESKVEHVYVSKWVEDGIEYYLYNNDSDDDTLDQEVIRMSRSIIEK